ncbi:hypothetical protein FQN57_004628 [Myotisia sp. PD_48]|nr:hypothetical protein FQN57_004628 [Myotisia sp. PD_48]
MADSSLAHFTEITGATPEVATQYLQLTDYNLETAMQLFFENGGNAIQPTQPSSTQAPQQSSSTRHVATHSSTSRYQEDEHGVVHIDSDSDDQGPPPPPNQGHSFDADLEMARQLQEEFFSGGDPITGGDPDAIRAPIERRTETLVGPDIDADFGSEMMEQMRSRGSMRRAGRPGIFNQRDVSTSIWSDDAESSNTRMLSRATGGASETSSKASMLAEMYRPPFEIMSRLPWDLARDEGREKMKWLLVNIQDPSVFDCQLLNRDLWKNDGIRETIRVHFIFLQFSKDDPRGAPYLQYYLPGHEVSDNYPHISIVDPRTGEQMKTWTGPPVIRASDFLMQLHEFLDRYSLDTNVRNPVAKRKPELAQHAKIDSMTEEEMLEMAMRNSLEGKPQSRQPDPDELTRSIGDIKGKGKVVTEVDKDEDMAGTQDETEDGEDTAPGEAESQFLKIPSNRPHTEPSPDPATTTRIQFRHSSGRVIRRFGLSETVQRLYEWLKASPLEDKAGVPFELVSMGQNLIGLLDQTVEEAGLKNGTIMVGFLEN